MNYFIIQSLNFSHLFQKEAKLLQLESLGLVKKLQAKKAVNFEQFILEHFMVSRIDYIQIESFQRVLTARMLIDLNEQTNNLMNGYPIENVKKYKQFYQKYQTHSQVLDLWLKWMFLKNKQVKQKPHNKQLKYLETIILPKLSNFKNTLIRLKFLIFQCVLNYLIGNEQQSIHQLVNLKQEFYIMYNLKSFVTEFHLLNQVDNIVYLSNKIINAAENCFSMPKEDFFQFIYAQIKLLVPISQGIAPSLTEDIFHEIDILILTYWNFNKKKKQQIDQQLSRKFDQVSDLLNKFYEKYGKKLFNRKHFKLEQKPTHKIARSLISFLSSEDQLKQSSTFKRDTHYESISSLYNAQQLQQIQLDLTKQSERVVKSTHHSRQASITRNPSQFQPESILSKEMWLEVDNYKIKSFQKRKAIHAKPSIGKIYQNIITSVPQTKRQSQHEDMVLIKNEIIQEVFDSKMTSKEPTKFFSQLTTPKPKIGIMTLVVLFNLRFFHLETPGGKRLPKLITKHFLKILTYIDDPPYQIISDRQLKMKELLKKSNRKSRIIRQNSFAIKPILGLKSQFINQKAVFSSNVKTTINKIRTLIKMGVFRKKRLQEKQLRIMGPVQSKPQAISNFLDFDRFKTAPDIVDNVKDRIQNIQTSPTPSNHGDSQQNSTKELGRGKGFGFFKTICMAKKLSVINYNKEDIVFLQEKYGTLQQAKQHLYYPTLKYSIIFQNSKQIWKIKYKDLTADKKFLVLYVSEEGSNYNFYRFDLPVIQKGKEKTGITIWPVVAEAIKELDKFKQYSQIFHFDLTDNVKKNFHSFISGLTSNAKQKLTLEDIKSCGYVQSYLCQFHKSQIAKIKKISGYSFEILPNINYTTIKYINMNQINRILSYEYHSERIKNIQNSNKNISTQSILSNKELTDYLANKNKTKNSILLFRFMCTSKQFFIDGNPSVNLKGFSYKLFTTVFKISNERYKFQFKKCFEKYVLLTLEIEIIKDIKFFLNDLLSPELKRTNQMSIPQVYGQQINRQFFELKVSCSLFQKEKQNDGKNNIFIESLNLQIQTYHQLIEYLEVEQKHYQSIKFEKLIYHLLYQSEYSQTQKELLNLFMLTYIDVDVVSNKIILKNDTQIKNKKMSMKFMKKEEKNHLLYAISPIESQFVKFTMIISEKEQRIEQMFKININTQIQQYDDIFQGKQVIEEPDFMANNQEVLQALNSIKQIPLYQQLKKGCLQNFRKFTFFSQINYKILEFINPKKKKALFIPQSPYVNCQLPSAMKLKTLILNKNKELMNYFNSNHYRFYVNRKQNFIVHVSVYYTFDRKLDIFNHDQKCNERIYYFDGEMFYVNLQLELLTSKTTSVKLIFSYQDLIDLFKITIDQYEHIFYFDDKFIQIMTMTILNNTYTERKFLCQLPTFIHRHFQSKKSRQTFIDYKRSISISSDSPKSTRGNIIQINNLNLLERHNNCQFVKLFYDSKEGITKNYCETYLKEARVIGHYIKKLRVGVKNSQLFTFKTGNTEFSIITVYSHLIIDIWIIQIYVPKTSRYLLGTINFLDLSELEDQDIFSELFEQTKIQRKSVYLRKFTTNKIILNKQQIFINLHKFFEFTRDINNSLNRKLIYQQLLQSQKENDFKQGKQKVEFNIWTQIINLLKLSLKDPFNIRLESESQNKNYLEKNLIEQLEQDTNVNVNSFQQIGKNYLQKKKNQSMENQELLNHFKSLSSNYQTLIKEKQVITLKSQFQDSSQICIDLGFKANLKEFIHTTQLKIDKIGLYTIQFFLEYMNVDMGRDNPFTPFESINYANSSMFNIAIRVLGFQSDSPIFYKQQEVNLREILNLFIADGYFKYQTNYMNAKLSLSDMRQICEYIGFKVKSQNFLGLANQQKYINSNPIFLEEAKQEHTNSDGITFTKYKKGKLIILQLFQEHQKVHVNLQDVSKGNEFSQQKIYFPDIEEKCPYFTHLVNNGLQRQALVKFMKTL